MSAATNPAAVPDDPVFTLHGVAFLMSDEIYRTIRAEYPARRKGFGSPKRAIKALDVALAMLFPGGFNAESFAVVQNDRRRMLQLLAVLHIATLSGVHVYPPPETVH